MPNPLEKYYRQPAIYISLPSNGKYWDPQSLTKTPNNEYGVLPMNGIDEMTIRNADGLMNGSSTVSMIQSCIPAIKDAWSMPSIDMDTILIAIRIATYGNQMPIKTKCSKCSEELEYDVDLSDIKDRIKIPSFADPVTINNLMFVFKPTTYKDTNEANQEQYIQQRTMTSLKNPNISDDEKIKIFREAVDLITHSTVSKMVNFVECIITDQGEKVSDRNFIHEFINNADRNTFTAISDAIGKLNKSYQIPEVKTTCNHCNHTESRVFQYDPSNFFVSSS